MKAQQKGAETNKPAFSTDRVISDARNFTDRFE